MIQLKIKTSRYLFLLLFNKLLESALEYIIICRITKSSMYICNLLNTFGRCRVKNMITCSIAVILKNEISFRLGLFLLLFKSLLTTISSVSFNPKAISHYSTRPWNETEGKNHEIIGNNNHERKRRIKNNERSVCIYPP